MNEVRSRPRGFNSASAHSFRENAHFWFFLRAQHGAVFTCHYQGVSHAEWSKDKHEYAPTQIGSVICWPLKAWSSNAARPEQNGSHNAQRNYERYLALAQAEAQSGNTVGAENYYQHAEHYFRSMSSDRGAT